jgi:hypothetical protein
VVAQSQGQVDAPEGEGGLRASQTARSQPQGSKNPSRPPLFSPWTRAGLAVALAAVLGLSFYALEYRPFQAARVFNKTFQGPPTLQEHLAVAQAGIDTFPLLANGPRLILFAQLAERWPHLTPQERGRVRAVVLQENQRAYGDAPKDPRLLARAVVVLQAVKPSQDLAQELDPLVNKLVELAPRRVYTYQIRARQHLLREDPREALRLIAEYESQAPWAAQYLAALKQAARESLESGKRGP